MSTKYEEIFYTGREYKIHVYTHSYNFEAKMIKCKNCNFEAKSVYSMEVHVANGKTKIFNVV